MHPATLIRRISGTHKVGPRNVPNVTNDTGLNRVVWDFHEDGPTQWMGALREEYRGPKTGTVVIPGTYTARISLSGKTLTQTFDVKADPRLPWTQTQYAQNYAFSKRYNNEYGQIDAALNGLDDVKKSLSNMEKSPKTHAISGAIADLRQKHDRIFDTLTANYANDEDSIQRPGALREDVEGLLRLTGPPLPSLLDFARRTDERYATALAAYNGFVTHDVPAFNATARSAGLQPIKAPAPLTYQQPPLAILGARPR